MIPNDSLSNTFAPHSSSLSLQPCTGCEFNNTSIKRAKYLIKAAHSATCWIRASNFWMIRLNTLSAKLHLRLGWVQCDEHGFILSHRSSSIPLLWLSSLRAELCTLLSDLELLPPNATAEIRTDAAAVISSASKDFPFEITFQRTFGLVKLFMLSEKRSQSHFYILLECFRHNLRKKLITAYKKTKSSDLSLLASFDTLSIWHYSSLNSSPHPRSPTAHDLIRGLFRQIWLQFSPSLYSKTNHRYPIFGAFPFSKITFTNTFGHRVVPISFNENSLRTLPRRLRSLVVLVHLPGPSLLLFPPAQILRLTSPDSWPGTYSLGLGWAYEGP
ncbi:2158_t:CDS:2 [Rhizophagus irregularis]|nr:2158_t:CDS:2 [Rhizophagus irregularis]